MKIGFDATPLLRDLSGIGFVAYSQAKELIKSEELEFFYAWFWSDKLRERPLGAYEKSVEFVKRYIPRPYILTHSLKSAIFNIGIVTKKLDVFYQPNYITFPMIKNVPIVTTVHDLSHIRFPEYHPKDRVDHYTKNLKNSLKRSAKVIAISEFTKSELLYFNLCEEDKIEVIYNGIDERFRPIEDLGSLYRYALQKQNYFLFVGTLEPRKNLKTLLRAYLLLFEKYGESLPDLAIVGNIGWNSELFDDILQQALKNQKVKKLGYVPSEDLPLLYSGAKAFILPSFYEGFGLPVIEAMACGTPVICSDNSSLKEISGDGAMLVKSNSIDSISIAIEKILEDSLICEDLIKKGFEIKKKFSWKDNGRKLIKTFESAQ